MLLWHDVLPKVHSQNRVVISYFWRAGIPLERFAMSPGYCVMLMGCVDIDFHLMLSQIRAIFAFNSGPLLRFMVEYCFRGFP